jgi:hypothetical protein
LGVNTTALMVRLELFVDEHRWLTADRNTQIGLNTVMSICEENIIPYLRAWNYSRTLLAKSKNDITTSIYKINIPISPV